MQGYGYPSLVHAVQCTTVKMDQMKKLKSIIRGHLMAEPYQKMTVGELMNRLRAEEGIEIPFTKFGFQTPDDFFRSIDDTVTFSGTGRSADLRPVVNAQVGHIQSLIENQKRPKIKKKKREFIMRQPMSSYPSSQSRPTQSYWNASRPTNSVPSCAHEASTVSKRSPIPSLLDRTISRPNVLASRPNVPDSGPNVLASRPNLPDSGPNLPDNVPESRPNVCHGGAVGLPAVSKAVAKKEEVFLPRSMQENISQLLRQEPGLALAKFKDHLIKAFPHVGILFPNIEELVTSLKSLVLSEGCVYLCSEEASGGANQNLAKHTAVARNSIIPAGMETEQNGDLDDEYRGINASAKGTSYSGFHTGQVKRLLRHYAVEFKPQLFAGDAASAAQYNQTGSVPMNMLPLSKALTEKLVELLDFYPKGMWCSLVPDLFQKYHRSALNYQELGYKKIADLFKNYPDFFVCINTHQTDWKVFNIDKYTCETPYILESVQSNIIKLLDSYPNGIHIDQFADTYALAYQRTFSYRDMKFDSIDELFFSLHDTLITMKPVLTRFVLCPLAKAIEESAVNLPLPKTLDDLGIGAYLLEDCVGPDYVMPKLVLPEFVGSRAIVPVLVGTVMRPNDFYVMIRGEGYSDALNDLTDDMFAFYEDKKAKYVIPTPAIVPGMPCVAITLSEYTRGVVVSIKGNRVTVNTIDFGSWAFVIKSSVFFMREQFAQLPPQAIDCRCANLVPPLNDTRFSRRSAERLLELVQDRGIAAIIVQYDRERQWLSVCLVDTTGKDDVHVNDVLVKEGLASYRLEPAITGMVKIQRRLKRHPRKVEKVPAAAASPVVPPTAPPGGPLEAEPKPCIGPPPGFKPLTESEIKINKPRLRGPHDTRLFPDLDQLMLINQLPKEEAVVKEVVTLPSLTSLEERHQKELAKLKEKQAQEASSKLTWEMLNCNIGERNRLASGAETLLPFQQLPTSHVAFSLPVQRPVRPPMPVNQWPPAAQNYSSNASYSFMPARSQNQQAYMPPQFHAFRSAPVARALPIYAPIGVQGTAMYSFPPPYRMNVAMNPPGYPPVNPPFIAPFANGGVNPFFTPQPNMYQSFPQFIKNLSNQFNYIHPPQPFMPRPNLDWNIRCPLPNYQQEQANMPHRNKVNVNTAKPRRSRPTFEKAANLTDEAKEGLVTPENDVPMMSDEQVWRDQSAKKPGAMKAGMEASRDSDCSDRSSGDVRSQSILSIGSDSRDTDFEHSEYETCTEEVKALSNLSVGSNKDRENRVESYATLQNEEEVVQDAGQEECEAETPPAPEQIPVESENGEEVEAEESESDEEMQEGVEENATLLCVANVVQESSKEKEASPNSLHLPNSEEKRTSKATDVELSSSVPSKEASKLSAELKTTETVSKKFRFVCKIDAGGKLWNVFWISQVPHLDVEAVLSMSKRSPAVTLKIVKTKSINNKIKHLKIKTYPEVFAELAELGTGSASQALHPKGKLLLVSVYDLSELLSVINMTDAVPFMTELYSQIYTHTLR